MKAAASLPLPLAACVAVIASILIATAIGEMMALCQAIPPELSGQAAHPDWYYLHIRRSFPQEILTILRTRPVAAFWLVGLPLFYFIVAEIIAAHVVYPLNGSVEDPYRAKMAARRFVWSLGAVWLAGQVLLWLVLFIPCSILFIEWLPRDQWTRQTVGEALQTLVVPATTLVPLLWLLRLIRAGCSLSDGRPAEVPVRCEECGYLLTGLDRPERCPECGAADPHVNSQERAPSPWVHQRINRLRAWRQIAWAVAVHPRRFFRRLAVLQPPGETAGLLSWSIAAVVVITLTMAATICLVEDAAYTRNYVGFPFDLWWGQVAYELSFAGVLGGLLGLLAVGALAVVANWLTMSLRMARQEPSAHLAANAVFHLSCLVAAGLLSQVAWIAMLSSVDVMLGGSWFETLQQGLSSSLNVGRDRVVLLLAGWPGFAGIVLVVRSSAACFRSIRYASR